MGEGLHGTRREDVLNRENVCRVRVWVFSPDAHVDKRPRMPAQRRCPLGEQRNSSNIEYTIRTRKKTPANRTGPFFSMGVDYWGAKVCVICGVKQIPHVQRDSGYTGIMRESGSF